MPALLTVACTHSYKPCYVPAAELLPGQAKKSLPPNHPLLQNGQPKSTTVALMTPPSPALQADLVPASSQNLQTASIEVVKDPHKAGLDAETLGVNTTAVGSPATAAVAPDAEDVGMASGSSKGSSHRSIAAAASGVVTRLMRASTDYMSGASQQASDALEAEQTWLSQPEQAGPSHLGALSEQATAGQCKDDNKLPEVALENENRVKSGGHGLAVEPSDQPDLVITDVNKADEAVAEADAGAAAASAPVTTGSPEPQSRLV